MLSPCLHLCKTPFISNHRLGFHNTFKSTLSIRDVSIGSDFQKLNSKIFTTQCQNKPLHRQNVSRKEGVEVKGKKENVWSIDNDKAKAAAEKEKGRAKQRRRGRRVVREKQNRNGKIMVSGAMLMEIETVLQTQEPVIRPAWNTFASSVSGIWKGVGAVFSPITAEMEPIEIGSRNEHLYDCYTLSHIETVPSPSGEQTSQIQRKIKWVTLNPYGEVLQQVGSNRLKDNEDGNASLPRNHTGNVGTSHILPDFESFDFELSDLMEEDVMGNEPGLVFFEDGSYSRGPVNIPVGVDDDSKYYLTPTFKFEQCLVKGCHKRLRIVHTIEFNNGGSDIQIMRVAIYEEQWVSPANIRDYSDMELDVKPFSQRKRTQPSELTGSWKVFEVNATPVFGDELVTEDSNSTPYVYFCAETLKKRSLPENPIYFGEEEIVDMQDVTVLWLPGGVTGYVDVRKMLRRVLLKQASTCRHFLSNGAATSISLPLHRSHSSYSSSSHSESPNATFAEHLENQNAQSTTTISVDRSGLYNPSEHSHEPTSESELIKHLKGIIKFRGGPITVAEYMEEVLTNPKAGFYINRDVFGAEGDFITSPEVSQMFGEMIGVWAMCLWEQMGQPKEVNLVELGPGRGTLMADLLRGISKFKGFTESLHIHMVECSPVLQNLQHGNLKCVEEHTTCEGVERRNISTLAGTPISWHASLEQVPPGSPVIIIAHEFYDALPVHQFQRASRGWCEKMVDISEDSTFRFVLSPQPTPATLYLMKRCKWAATEEEIEKLNHIEVCPKAMDLTHTIAKRISSDGGGALIIDYGLNGVVSDSLQAIRKHKFVDILDNPGSADLSAYVDFAAIRHSAEEASEDVSVHGPITQSHLLGSLGINFRVEALLQNCTDEQAESLRTGYWRLVGEGEAPFWEGPDEQVPIGMGTRYLAMAIVKKKQGVPVPFQ